MLYQTWSDAPTCKANRAHFVRFAFVNTPNANVSIRHEIIMRINFRQGLVSSEIGDNGQPNFLTSNSTGISLRTSNRPVVFSLANGAKDYTISFFTDVLAWPISLFTNLTEAWLYVDINQASSARRYGVTTVAPTHGAIAPATPVEGQMWFDTTKNVMKVYNSTSFTWATAIRVIAGHFQTTSLTSVQFGSQVGITQTVVSGSIMVDGFGVALKDSSGNFVTTEDVLMVDGASTYAAKLESNVTIAPAGQSIAAFHVVCLTTTGDVVPADYEDVGQNIIGLSTVDANANEPVNMVLSGKVHNPLWNWNSANITLWVGQNGELVAVDPFTQGNQPKQRVPVARTIDSTTIIFDQGLGGIGERGEPGDVAGVQNASLTVKGVAKLSVDPEDFANPIAIGANDPILTSPKVPIEHTHPAISVTVSPFGTFNGTNTQQALEYLQAGKLGLSGGTVIGNVSTNVQATLDAHLISLGQTRSLIAATTVSYKRYTLSVDEQSIVIAFNLLSSAQRTFGVNTTVVLEWKDSIYLWTGGIGTPVTATVDGQFLLIGKIVASGGVTPTIRTANGWMAVPPEGNREMFMTTRFQDSVMSVAINMGSGELTLAPFPLSTNTAFVPSAYNTTSGKMAVAITNDSTPHNGVVSIRDGNNNWNIISSATTYDGTSTFKSILEMSFNTSGSRLLMLHSGQTISNVWYATVFNTQTMAPIFNLPYNGTTQNSRLQIQAALSPDGTKLAVVEATSTVANVYAFKLYDVASGTVLASYTTLNCANVSFTPDGASIVLVCIEDAGTQARSVRVFSATNVPVSPPAITYAAPAGYNLWSSIAWNTINSTAFMYVNLFNSQTGASALGKINVTTGATTTFAIPAGTMYGGALFNDGAIAGLLVNLTTGAIDIVSIDPDTLLVLKTYPAIEAGSGQNFVGMVLL